MTVAAIASSINYTGDGASVAFAAPFRFNAPSDIAVTLTDTVGVETAPIYGVDYSVTGGATDAGGTVTFGTPPAAGVNVNIRRETSLSQTSDYLANDIFPSGTLEGDVDKLQLIAQEQDREIKRGPRYPRGAVTFDFADLAGLTDGDVLVASGGKIARFDRAAFAGKFLGGDATGGLVALSGTGNDAAFRADAAAAGGAALIGTTRLGSVQLDLDDHETRLAAEEADTVATSYARSSMESGLSLIQKALALNTPYALDQHLSDLDPTASNPVAAIRLEADWFLSRTYTATLDGGSIDGKYFDQQIYRAPVGWAEVDAGWQRVEDAVMFNGKWQNWLNSPLNQGDIPNVEFALRLIKSANAYHSGNEGPYAYYTGYGHGNAYVNPAGVTIYKDGVATNLQDTANWAKGAKIYCATNLVITTPFKLRALTDYLGNDPISTTSGSGVINVNHPNHGLPDGHYVKLRNVPTGGINGITYAQLTARQQMTLVDANNYTLAPGGSATSTGVGGGLGAGKSAFENDGIQVFADAVNLTYNQTLDVNGIANFASFAAAIAGFSVQDSYGYMDAFNSFDVSHIKQAGATAEQVTHDGTQKGNWNNEVQFYQAYNAGDPTLQRTMKLDYGPTAALRKNGSPVDLLLFRASIWRDLVDYVKWYHFIASSEESLPRTAWPLDPADTYTWQGRKFSEYRAGGPR